MASKEGQSGSAGNLTARDMEQLAAIFECSREEIKIDYAKFADRCRYKNANSAKAGWHALKKKLEKCGATLSGDQTSPTKPAASPAKPNTTPKKRKAAIKKEEAAGSGDDEDDDEIEFDLEPSPSKKVAESE